MQCYTFLRWKGYSVVFFFNVLEALMYGVVVVIV